MIKMKNILAENLLRFGVKNLNEADKRSLSGRLLTEGGSLDASVLTNMQTQIANYNTAYKKAYPNSTNYLVAYEGAQPVRSGSDETYNLYVVIRSTKMKGEIEVGKIQAQQDLNGTIFNLIMVVYDKPNGNYSTGKIGQNFANDPALTTAPTESTIIQKLTSFARKLLTDDPNFATFMNGNGQAYLVRAFMDAFNAVKVYPTSTRPNVNKQAGRQTQTGGAAKGTNPYKKS